MRSLRRLRFREVTRRLGHAAAVAALEGRNEAAIENLRARLSGALPPTFAHATRRHLGRLLGGDEGKALVAEADAFFRAGGAVDPERFSDILLPGFSALS